MIDTRALLITTSLFMPPQYKQKISVLTHKAHLIYIIIKTISAYLLIFPKFFQL